VVTARQRPRLTWTAQPALACLARRRYRVGRIPVSRSNSPTSGSLVRRQSQRGPQRLVRTFFRGCASVRLVEAGEVAALPELAHRPVARLGPMASR
jgi:hypothetical protein